MWGGGTLDGLTLLALSNLVPPPLTNPPPPEKYACIVHMSDIIRKQTCKTGHQKMPTCRSKSANPAIFHKHSCMQSRNGIGKTPVKYLRYRLCNKHRRAASEARVNASQPSPRYRGAGWARCAGSCRRGRRRCPRGRAAQAGCAASRGSACGTTPAATPPRKPTPTRTRACCQA